MIEQAIGGLWTLWVITWFIVAGWSARTVKTTRPGERGLEILLTLAGIGALWAGNDSWLYGGEMAMRLYTLSAIPGWLLFAVVACGFVFCWWARVHLGKMWSANITLKEEHRIVDTGPYALVRHPIYSGILLSAWATAVARGNQLAFVGAALLTVGFYLKARREEQLLIEELGAPYLAYLRRVPMLFPYSTGARRSA
jgi:protein-S-isoprenylcysteine O-methyltransferase Ste14